MFSDFDKKMMNYIVEEAVKRDLDPDLTLKILQAYAETCEVNVTTTEELRKAMEKDERTRTSQGICSW